MNSGSLNKSLSSCCIRSCYLLFPVGSAKNNQKFPPVYAQLDRSVSMTSAQPSYTAAERQLLPRQQFVMLIIKVSVT